MSSFRFSIRTLLIAFAAVAIFFPIRNTFEPWRQTRLRDSNYTYLDCENLCAISEGDSLESVKRLFPSLIEVEPTTTLIHNLRLPNFTTADKIYRYSYPRQTGFNFFHFHDGCLASHPESSFSDPIAMTLARGASIPSALERVSVVPVYLGCLVGLGLTYGFFSATFKYCRNKMGIRELKRDVVE